MGSHGRQADKGGSISLLTGKGWADGGGFPVGATVGCLTPGPAPAALGSHRPPCRHRVPLASVACRGSIGRMCVSCQPLAPQKKTIKEGGRGWNVPAQLLA